MVDKEGVGSCQVTMHGCRGWGHHARVQGVGSPCMRLGVGSPCMGAGGGAEWQQVMGWLNFESVTSQPLHCLLVAGERCSLYRSALGSPYMEKGVGL